jgi:HlyD family secretion protein
MTTLPKPLPPGASPLRASPFRPAPARPLDGALRGPRGGAPSPVAPADRPLAASTAADRPAAGRYLLSGFLALLVLVAGLGGWAAQARISGAVIAAGTVEVEGNRQVVQHPTGGVIAAIEARDGDRVEAGAVLLRLEGDALRSDLAVVEGQYFEIVARKNRLAAERDGAETVAFDPELLARAEAQPEAAALVAAQIQQFEAHREALAEETAALGERRAQIGRQIEGLEAQRAAAAKAAALLAREIESQEALFAQGLTRQTQLLTPQRELARLEGEEGQIAASVAENAARIAEIDIEIVRLGAERRSAAIAELRELEYREIELRERRASLHEEVGRLELRAPVAGVVYASTADTLRAVVRPAEPVMFIVPEATPLVVRARIDPVHIDQVAPGQAATLRFPAFNARLTPEAEGTVARISADALRDERTGASHYVAEIRLGEEAEAALGGALLPGMPVDAFVRTEERSPLSYLVRPFADYFAKAFRES